LCPFLSDVSLLRIRLRRPRLAYLKLLGGTCLGHFYTDVSWMVKYSGEKKPYLSLKSGRNRQVEPHETLAANETY